MNFDFSNIKILLIGDFMIDHYLIGASYRNSPEAPVPVVIPQKEYSVPGGAGNVALNLKSMGAQVTCVGNVGIDKWGDQLLSILSEKDIDVDFLIRKKNYQTTLKKRIYSNDKQVLRIDNEDNISLKYDLSLINFNKYDVCIVSDYNKGMIDKIDFNHPLLIVDPKKEDFSLYKNADIITPNLNELKKCSSIKINDHQSIIMACNELIVKNNFKYVIAKQGDKGMTIIGENNFFKKIDAHSIINSDVTGAGDTVLAILSLVYTKTSDIVLSAKIANAAAAYAVSMPGTTTITLDKIKKYL